MQTISFSQIVNAKAAIAQLRGERDLHERRSTEIAAHMADAWPAELARATVAYNREREAVRRCQQAINAQRRTLAVYRAAMLGRTADHSSEVTR